MRLQKQNDQIKGGHVAEGKYICIRLYVFDDFHFCGHFQEGSISIVTVVKNLLLKDGLSRVPKLK